MRFFGAATSLIGLDLGSRVVKAAQLQRCRRGWRVRAVATVPRTLEQSLEQSAAQLTGVLERQGFSGRRVILAAPVRKLVCEMLDLPPRTSGAPIEVIAKAELGQAARLESGRFEMGCWDVPSSARSQGTAVIALGLRHEDADALVEPLESQGLEIVAIDAQGLALHRACQHLLKSDRATAMLDLGWSAASLHVANRETVLYQRTLWDSGIEYVLKTIVAEHGLGDDAAELVLRPEDSKRSGRPAPAWLGGLVRRFAEQLCDELQTSLAFAKQRYSAACGNELLLTGGGAGLPGGLPPFIKLLGRTVSFVSGRALIDFCG